MYSAEHTVVNNHIINAYVFLCLQLVAICSHYFNTPEARPHLLCGSTSVYSVNPGLIQVLRSKIAIYHHQKDFFYFVLTHRGVSPLQKPPPKTYIYVYPTKWFCQTHFEADVIAAGIMFVGKVSPHVVKLQSAKTHWLR